MARAVSTKKRLISRFFRHFSPKRQRFGVPPLLLTEEVKACVLEIWFPNQVLRSTQVMEMNYPSRLKVVTRLLSANKPIAIAPSRRIQDLLK